MDSGDSKRKDGSLRFRIKVIDPCSCESFKEASFPQSIQEVPFLHEQKVTNRDSSEGDDDDDDGRRWRASGANLCFICGRNFGSLKSLSGHMRCHPDRPWRGINPPSKIQKTSISTRSSKIPDLTKSLKGWRKKDRRGRKRKFKGSTLSYEWGLTRSQLEEDAVHDLMVIRAKAFEEKINKTKKTKTLQEVGVMSLTLDDDIINPIDIDNGGFKCITCDKSFTTHQALGGHRSSHNKMVLKQSLKFQGGEKTEGRREEEEEFNYESPHHNCRTCNKVFRTGQALGGHMRCHFAANSDRFLTFPDDPSNGKVVHDFDLNKIPSEGISLALEL